MSYGILAECKQTYILGKKWLFGVDLKNHILFSENIINSTLLCKR